MRVPRHFDDILTWLTLYEREYSQLTNAAFLLESALWKNKVAESRLQSTVEKDDWKEHCRLACGASVIIPNILPYLICECPKKTNTRYF